MSDATLLPPNATAQERAMEGATARVGAVPAPLRELWDPDTCPEDKLAFLAWAFNVDEWDPAWTEADKRATIRQAVPVQARKGSVWSIRRVLANAGYGEAELQEGLFGRRHNGVFDYDGSQVYGSPDEWATYRAILERPITNQQAAQVRRLLEYTAPARCKLLEFVYTTASNIYNGAIFYDGSYNHGTA